MTEPGPRLDPFAAIPPRTNGSAIWSVVLSSLGFVCLVGLGGLLGIALGLMARGEIDRSEGRMVGKRLANVGIGIGALNVVACVAGLAAMITYVARPSAPTPRYAAPVYAPAPAPTASAPPSSAGPRRTTATAAGGVPMPGAASRDEGVVVTRIGRLALVDIGPAVTSLRDALDAQRAEATKNGKKVLVWVGVQGCKPCNGVAIALPDPEMQRALSGVRLVRLDAHDFVLELQHLHIPIDKYPGFVLLGTDDRPVDYVHGGEWDADIPRNIAPVLGKFVRGTYTTRRDPWRGGSRDDETPL